MSPRRMFCLIALLAVSSVAGLRAATLVVDLHGGGGFTAIQPAIDAAAAGDEVLVKPGEYVITEPITFRGKAIAVRGEAGPAQTVIRMAEEPANPSQASVVVFLEGETGASILDGFTLTGGKGMLGVSSSGVDTTFGGGVESRASPTITGCVISGNSAAYGAGVKCSGSANRTTLSNCTIVGNTGTRGGGVYCSNSSSIVTRCIIWGNAGGTLYLPSGAIPSVSFSCLETQDVWPGEGNINVDPLFCGFMGPPDAYVDGAASDGGDGSAAHPFRDLTAALAYSLSLKESSLCLAAHMGADLGTCPPGTPSGRVIHLAAGTYPVDGLSLAYGASIVGAGPEETVLVGTVQGLRTGATLSDVLVTGGENGGIVIGMGESPRVENSTIAGNHTRFDGGGVSCMYSSPTFTGCTISRNTAGRNGGGVYCEEASPSLVNCTIAGNLARELGGGVYLYRSSPTVTSSIVWANVGGSWVTEESAPVATFSCLETGGEVLEGDGNLNADPLFCGYAGPPDTFVDAASPAGGDGSAERPFRDLNEALTFRLTLRESSPCIGTGAGGGTMGAATGTCEAGGVSACVVHVASGRYDVRAASLVYGASILGAGADETILEGTLQGLRTGAKLSHVTVTAGTAGGVVVGAMERPAIEQCTITGNMGPGVSCYQASPAITDCTISGNSATPSGAPGSNHSWAEIYGGGVSGWASSPILTRCMITDNVAHRGGGVCCGEGACPVMTDCAILRNRSMGGDGGGVDCLQSHAVMLRCTLAGNSASGNGGGLYCWRSSPILTDCTISGNCAGVSEYGTSAGGGVYCCDASCPVLTRCAISDNVATSYGGGMFCISRHTLPTLTDCTISGNLAGESGGGLAFANLSSAAVTRSAISGNAALSDLGGGGVYCAMSSSPTFTDCTIWGNSAPLGSGGALYCYLASPTLIYSTICANSAATSGGISCASGPVPVLTGCILWGNTPDSACGTLSDCLTELDPLFVDDGAFSYTRSVSVTIGDETYSLPDFVIRAPDYHLLPDSPAIDAGTCNGAPEVDIEGMPRPQGEACDLGAYEHAGCDMVVFIRGDANADMRVDISDAVAVLRHLFGGAAAPPCMRSADANDDGEEDLADAVRILGYLFEHGPVLPAPYPRCGCDRTADALGCERYAPCER